MIKNQQGKLGFHIQFQGIVGDVTEHGPAWAAGLRPSSRLLEVRCFCRYKYLPGRGALEWSFKTETSETKYIILIYILGKQLARQI